MLMFIRYTVLTQEFSKDNHSFLTKKEGKESLQEKKAKSFQAPQRRAKSGALCWELVTKSPSGASALSTAHVELQGILGLFLPYQWWCCSSCPSPSLHHSAAHSGSDVLPGQTGPGNPPPGIGHEIHPSAGWFLKKTIEKEIIKISNYSNNRARLTTGASQGGFTDVAGPKPANISTRSDRPSATLRKKCQ